MARTPVLLTLLLAVGGSGCVSLHTYDEQNRKIEALTAAVAGADKAIGRLKQQLQSRDGALRAKEQELAALRTRLQSQSSALAAERESLQAQYQQMLQELRAEGGTSFTINQQTGGIVLENDIFFASGKAELRPEAKRSLDGLIGKLNEPDFAGCEIEIAGHTDSDPIARSGWKDNYQLAAERARAVLLYFIERGIAPERIYLSGYGPTRPRSNDKSENRRVEVVLHRKGA
ncbi:MAG: hypothetical protein KatS3mg102_1136 [Planctomycetota bacterium]|nr:MAG: hypothetical protein KatS3mg102_1136 [Planctomycetota bacterium]